MHAYFANIFAQKNYKAEQAAQFAFEKRGHKMLMKLTTGVNFIHILT